MFLLLFTRAAGAKAQAFLGAVDWISWVPSTLPVDHSSQARSSVVQGGSASAAEGNGGAVRNPRFSPAPACPL